MSQVNIYDPVEPWPEDYAPLDFDAALETIATGSHLGAQLGQRDPRTDRVLTSLVSTRLATCALTPEGILTARPTYLARMRQYN